MNMLSDLKNSKWQIQYDPLYFPFIPIFLPIFSKKKIGIFPKLCLLHKTAILNFPNVLYTNFIQKKLEFLKNFVCPIGSAILNFSNLTADH